MEIITAVLSSREYIILLYVHSKKKWGMREREEE